MMSVYMESKITIPEERYNELIRAEYALVLVRRMIGKKAPMAGLEWVTLDKNEVDVLLALTGKGGEEA